MIDTKSPKSRRKLSVRKMLYTIWINGIDCFLTARPTIVTSTPTSTQIPGDANEQVDLTCIVSGKPPPTLSWKRQLNGQDLSSLNDNKVKSITKERDTSVLRVIVTAIGEHFYCVAVNLLGSNSQQYTIRKRGKSLKDR